MAFDYNLAKEIYGMTPWFVDQQSLPVLLGILNNSKNGISLDLPEIKYNTPYIFKVSNETRIISKPFGDRWSPGQLENKDDFEGIGIVNIDGPITKNGGASSLGTAQISSIMMEMYKDERIKSFILLGDSGGGSSNAVKIMVKTINLVKQTKPVYGFIPDGGMAASAMYGIMSACDKIYSEDDLNIVGSAGTMIQFEGRKANSESPDGVKYVRVYATKSEKKNEGFEQALNNDNYQVIIDNLLDPLNQSFLDLIVSNRPVLAGTDFDNGKTLFSKDAVGTFIDGIASFGEVVNMLQNDVKASKKIINNNTNLNQNKVMDAAALKQAHPETYNSIFAAGVSSGIANEKDRTGAYMAHLSTDPEGVKKGIESGEAISATQREEFLVKASSAATMKKLEADSAPAVVPQEAGGELDKPTEAASFYASVLNQL